MASDSRTDMKRLRDQLLEIRCFWESATPGEKAEFVGDKDRDELDRTWFWLWGLVYRSEGLYEGLYQDADPGSDPSPL